MQTITDFYTVAGMGGDFNRGGPADYGRTDSFGGARTAEYPPRSDYDRGVSGPMRNGGATTAYGGGFTETGYDYPKLNTIICYPIYT